MTLKETMAMLKKMGTAQNAKVYKRHGAADNMFGVSFANLNKLKKQIRTDHNLAEQLWRTGNVDAQTLACMIADPEKLKSVQADQWLKDIDYHIIADSFAGIVAKTKFAPAKISKWTRSKKEYTRQCGYSVLASLLKYGAQISDKECEDYLKTIESEIHDSANRTRYAMNNALIAIGVYRDKLTNKAISVAKKVGKVEVDHGETSCRTPDAVSYIKKSIVHLNKKKK